MFRSRAVNVGLHLAWQFNPIHDRERHRLVDVGGSKNFFRAAEAAGLKRLVHVSSATAYTGPGNPTQPPFISEAAPVSGTPRYLYSKHKAEVDRLAQDFLARHPEIEVVILRPSIVLGPHTKNIVSQMFDWPWRGFPWILQVRGADPPLQFMSEADVGEVLYRAVTGAARGVFNCAGDGVIACSEFLRATGKAPLPLPAALVYPLAGALWALRLAPFPAGILDMIRYPWVVDNARLKSVFGYTPRHTSRQALESFIAARGRRSNDRRGARQKERFNPERAARLDDPARFEYLPPEEVLRLLDIPPNAKLVDFGTGTGTYAIELARRRPDVEVIALDELPEMLDRLRAKPAAALTNLKPLLAGQRGALASKADRVLALNVLHEMGDEALRDLGTLLKPHGTALFIDWNGAVERPAGPPPDRVYRPAEARERLEQMGFVVEMEHYFSYHYAFRARRRSLI